MEQVRLAVRARDRWSGGPALAAVLVTLLLATATAPVAARASSAEPPRELHAYYVSDPNEPLKARATLARLMAVPPLDNGWVPQVRTPFNGHGVACPPRRCLHRRLALPSSVKVTSSMVRVLLPRGYHKKRNRKVRYPVVYLFNGALSSYDMWSRKTQITALSKQHQAIFVMPEGAFAPVPGMFADWHDGSYQWESFHTKVVVPWVDRSFRTLPGARAAIGASMGSLGSIGYAQRHPGMFKAVMSISGILDTRSLSANILPEELAAALGVQPPDMKRVYGNPVLQRRVWRRHNPAENAEKLKGVTVLVSSGTGFLTGDATDPVRNGTMETVLWNTNRTFLQALTRAGVRYEARVARGGVHNWPWFHNPLVWGLPKLIAAARR
jgi:S-formylglutathione hydrolase FrmB